MSDAEETILNFDDNKQSCLDGEPCTHNCNGDCFREKFCKPNPESGLNKDWTPKNIEGNRYK
jgi:hypothetical protein